MCLNVPVEPACSRNLGQYKLVETLSKVSIASCAFLVAALCSVLSHLFPTKQ